MTRDDLEILGRETLHEGFFRVNRYRLRHRLFGGGWSRTLTREVFERGPVAGVLPYDPARDAVVLIEQFRTGPMAAGDDNSWLVEIVAGIVEDGEAPEDMVLREAMEEAGCTITDIEPIASFYPSPGGSSEYVDIFCGRTDSTGIGGLHGNASEDEDIRVFAESFEAAYGRLRTGGVVNSISIVALQWLALNRDDLRRRWT